MAGIDFGSAVTDQNRSAEVGRTEGPTPSSDATVAGRRQDAGSAKPTLLWIDDEISRESGGVKLLEFEGYKVDCAVTGAAGLALARARQYRGLLLDLRLPDIPGLAVLATLRSEAISTPVMVLTGFGDTDSAFAARYFGADQFKCKPLFGDDFSIAVKRLLEGAPPVIGEDVKDVLAPHLRGRYLSIATLLEGLHRLSRKQRVAISSPQVDLRERVAAALIRALTNSDLPMPMFLACAGSLKHTMDADATRDSRSLVTDAEENILESLSRPAPSDTRVIAVLKRLEAAATERKRMRREDVAKAQGVDVSRLSRLVNAETGFEFTQWRTAFLLRPCLSALTETNEHVKQIACRLLCFSDETQFIHEFTRMFGASPTEFRQLWQSQGK